MFSVSLDNISPKIGWDCLKNRLLSACPSCLEYLYLCRQSSVSKPPSLYLFKFFCCGRKGLIHVKCIIVVFCLVFLVFSLDMVVKTLIFGDF